MEMWTKFTAAHYWWGWSVTGAIDWLWRVFASEAGNGVQSTSSDVGIPVKLNVEDGGEGCDSWKLSSPPSILGPPRFHFSMD